MKADNFPLEQKQAAKEDDHTDSHIWSQSPKS